MKKKIVMPILAVVILGAAIFGLYRMFFSGTGDSPDDETSGEETTEETIEETTEETAEESGEVTTEETDKEEPPVSEAETVANLVLEFGKRLQMVSLLAPSDSLDQSMQENYGRLVAPSLIEKWKNDPRNAPGRMVSSPWPDHIEILSNEEREEGIYQVAGEVIELTSVEQASGGFAAKRPISLIVKKSGDIWLIDDVALGAYVDTESVLYDNAQYGFTFTLPKSWKNYTIILAQWNGVSLEGAHAGEITETGPIINIRHPAWTSENPRQDIPIMIFTLDQWEALMREEFNVGAAPMPPGELGRNASYVFALPARYNYAFLTGFEEVEEILAGNPLQMK